MLYHVDLRSLMYEPITLILVGWFLGIFSSLFTFYFQQSRRKRSIKKGINLELMDSRARLMVLAQKLRMRYGTLDRAFINSEYDAVSKIKHDAIFTKTAAILEQQKSFSDEKLAMLNEVDKSDPEKSLAMKTFSMPYLQYKIGELPMFSEKFQYRCLSILSDLRILNQAVEESIFFFKISYTPSLTEETYDRAKQMIELSYQSICERAEKISQTISGLF